MKYEQLLDLVLEYLGNPSSTKMDTLTESAKKKTSVKRVNDKGESVPDLCPECGSKIGLYLRGEPVWLCSNKKCEKYFGTLPFQG